MKVKKIRFKELENNLCDGVQIVELLGDDYDFLFVDELNCSYGKYDDEILNKDFKAYLHGMYREESRKNFNI